MEIVDKLGRDKRLGGWSLEDTIYIYLLVFPRQCFRITLPKWLVAGKMIIQNKGNYNLFATNNIRFYNYYVTNPNEYW